MTHLKINFIFKVFVHLTNGHSRKKVGKLEVRPKIKGPHLIFIGKLGKFSKIRKVHSED